MSFKVALLLFLLTFSLVYSRILFRGEVIFPHDNAREAGCESVRADLFPSNRKFSDQSAAFIPELANNLEQNRMAWLATWNPHTELGRPASQLSGLNRSYLLTNGLMCFITNPFTLYTVLVLIVVALTGIFFLLFLRALGLLPAASLVGAIGLALTTAISYWATFVMFLFPVCWTVCLLWLITEFLRAPSWMTALGLAFATYSLLLTAYPQVIILDAYLVGGFVLFRLQKENSVRSFSSLVRCWLRSSWSDRFPFGLSRSLGTGAGFTQRSWPGRCLLPESPAPIVTAG